MRYSHDISACFSAAIGRGGLAEARLAALTHELEAVRGALEARLAEGTLPIFALDESLADLGAAPGIAERWQGRFRDVLLLGTGGSSLGAKTLYGLVDRGLGPPPGCPRLHFLENVDPDSLAALQAVLDWSSTGLIAVSKSGTTAETLMQSLLLLPAMERALGRGALAEQALIVTEPKESPLARLAGHYGVPTLDHHPGIGGRFSVLSLVGLLPALIAGLDAAAVRRGASEVLDQALAASRAGEVPAAQGAALAVGLARDHGVSQSVLLAYVDRLADFGLWYRQLWAESLGKAGHGTTPIRAMGTVDQHSQLQLYLDGPADKLVTVLDLETESAGPAVDPALAEAVGLEVLGGRTPGDLLGACARATAETLARRGRPVRRMTLPQLDEATLGALLMHFMLETIFAAALFGVDPFDQPAVEEGKVLARDYLRGAEGVP